MTLTATFNDARGVPRPAVRIRFTPESNPAPDQGGVLSAKEIEVTTDNNGAISLDLEQGLYLVTIGNAKRDTFRIVVDDSAASADLRSLMVVLGPLGSMYAPASGSNYQKRAGDLQLYNVDTGMFNAVGFVGSAGSESPSFGDGDVSATALNWKAGLSNYGLNYQLKDTKLQWKNPGTALYHTVWVIGGAGMETLSWEAGEAQFISAGIVPLQMVNARVRDGYLQYKNRDTGKYHTLFTLGEDGATSVQIGTAET